LARKRIKTIAALGAALGLLAAACGDDDGGGGATTAGGGTTAAGTTAAPGTTAAGTTAAPATTAAGTTAAPATTTAGSTAAETTTAETTAAPTTAAAGGEFGLIDGVYKGIAGFELDPADCPEDWNPTQGITDTEIRLFESLPQSGPLAGFGLIGDGMQSYFNLINETEGGVDGRQIKLDFKDDTYQADKTKINVDEAVQSGNYAAMVTIIGSPNNLAVWDGLNDECMPQLLNGTGLANWGDVENHPWTTGMQLDYFSEAGLWAKWLQDNAADKKTVAMVTFNNDFGKAYSSGFRHFIEGTGIEVVAEEFHEPTAPNLTNQFTTLAATNADVLLIQTSGAFCTQAMAEIEKGSWKPLVIMSATCGSLNQFFQPLIDQGLTGAGTHLIQTFIDVNDAAYADVPFVKLYHDTLKAQGLDSSKSTYATGWIFGYYMVEILKKAATYEGGLDRGNIMLASRALDEPVPLLFEGLTSIMKGTEDAYLIEGGRMAVYKVTDPTKLGTFEGVGELINNEGQTGTFADVSAAGG
jgi:ABC-type branched-subunit amino acid transport system substrate-binding protein